MAGLGFKHSMTPIAKPLGDVIKRLSDTIKEKVAPLAGNIYVGPMPNQQTKDAIAQKKAQEQERARANQLNQTTRLDMITPEERFEKTRSDVQNKMKPFYEGIDAVKGAVKGAIEDAGSRPTENQINTGMLDPKVEKNPGFDWNSIVVAGNDEIQDHNSVYDEWINQNREKRANMLGPGIWDKDQGSGTEELTKLGDGYTTRGISPESAAFSTMSWLDPQQQADLSTGVSDSKNISRIANKFKTTAIDDGSSFNIENLTSNTMTGKQYKLYQSMGMGGRDADDIDDNSLYSKVEERQDYGFIPYVPDSRAANKMNREALMEMPTRAANDLATLRDNLDYSIEYNGEKYSGKEIDEKLPDYLKKDFGDVLNYDTQNIPEGATKFKIQGYRISLADGTTMTVKTPRGLQFRPLKKGTANDPLLVVVPETGDEFWFDNDADFRNSVQIIGYAPVTSEEDQVTAWAEMPELELNDGRKIGYDDAIALSQGGGDRDYWWFNLAKPSYATDDFITDKGFNFADFAPKMVDLALGSAPYFFLPTSIPLGASNAMVAARGVDPTTVRKGESKKAKEDQTDEEYLSSIVGNLITPFTEMGLGRIGSVAAKHPLAALSRRIGERAWMPAAEHAIGTAGEGLEEIVANPVDELRSHGLYNMFANEQKDEEGNTIYDSTGHAVMDSDTSLQDRAGNFVAQVPEAFLGGAFLGAAAGIPTIKESYYDRARELYDRNKAAKESGLGIYKRGKKSKNKWQELTPEERAFYDEER